jgi:hypothetical protein
MDRELVNSEKVTSSRASLDTGFCMERENLHGLMARSTKENSETMKYLGMAVTTGLIKVFMKAK